MTESRSETEPRNSDSTRGDGGEPELSPGRRVGRYVLVRELGGSTEGAGGRCVWLARDEERSRDVALKLAPADRGSREQELQREFDWLLLLVHEQLPEVYELGLDTDLARAWVALEYVDGVTLDRALSEGTVDPAILLWQACRALAFLHEGHGVVHGDLKPENILVRRGPDGPELKLIDLGLSSRLGAGERGVVRGTPYYAAPSVLSGLPPSAKSDLFALGASFNEGLTGRREPGALAAAGATPELARILARMVRDDEDSRYSSARQVLRDLHSMMPDRVGIGVRESERSEFVGRSAEMTWIARWLEELKTGRALARVVAIAGEAGIGKSRLLEEAGRRANLVRVRVVRGRPPEQAGECYQPLLDALDVLALGEVDLELRERLIELRGRLAGAGSRPGWEAKPEDRDAGLWVEAIELLEVLARRAPLLITIDDLELDETPFAGFLAMAARRAEHGALGFLVGLASTVEGEATARSRSYWDTALAGESGSRLLELERLTDAESRRLVGSILRAELLEDEVCGEVAEATAGHPQFAVATAVAIARESRANESDLGQVYRRELPRTLAAALERQVAALGRDDREAVERLSVLELAAPRSVVHELLEASALTYTLPTLLEATVLERVAGTEGIGVESESRIRFRSQVLRRQLCEALARPRRMELERAAMEAWLNGAPDGMRALAVTGHALRSGEASTAARFASTALEHLLASHALGSVIALGTRVMRAVTTWEDPGDRLLVLERVADAHLEMGEHAKAVELYDSVRRESLGPSWEARVLRKSALARDGLGDSARAREDLLDALAHESEIDPGDRLAICQFLGMVEYRRGQTADAEAWLKRGLECLADPEREFAASGIWNNLGVLDMYRNRSEEGRRHFERALRIREAHGDLVGCSRTLNNLGSIAMISGALAEARVRFSEALRIKRRLGDRRAVALTLSNLAQLDHWVGSYGPAIQQYEEALAIRVEVDDVAGEVTTRAHLADLWRLKGDLREAREQAGRARARSEGRSDVARVNALLASCDVELALGQYEGARHHAEAGLATARLCQAAADEALLLSSLGEADLATGRGAGRCEEAVDLARRIDNPRVLAAVLAARAEGALSRDEFALAEEAAEEVLAIAGRLELRYLAARAELVLGCVAGARGEPDEASRRLHRAEEFALLFAAPELTWRVYFALGSFHREQGRENRALQWIEKCLAVLRGVVEGLRNESLERTYLDAPNRATALTSMEAWMGEDDREAYNPA